MKFVVRDESYVGARKGEGIPSMRRPERWCGAVRLVQPPERSVPVWNASQQVAARDRSGASEVSAREAAFGRSWRLLRAARLSVIWHPSEALVDDASPVALIDASFSNPHPGSCSPALRCSHQ